VSHQRYSTRRPIPLPHRCSYGHYSILWSTFISQLRTERPKGVVTERCGQTRWPLMERSLYVDRRLTVLSVRITVFCQCIFILRSIFYILSFNVLDTYNLQIINAQFAWISNNKIYIKILHQAYQDVDRIYLFFVHSNNLFFINVSGIFTYSKPIKNFQWSIKVITYNVLHIKIKSWKSHRTIRELSCDATC